MSTPINVLATTEGQAVLSEVDSLILDLAKAEVSLTKARTRIGILLTKVSEGGYWKLAGCKSFGEYMESLEERFNRGRTQLYHYFGLVRDLLPEVGEEKLSAMGLEKAKLVRKAKNETGTLPAAEILDAATDPKVTTKDFQKLLLGEKPVPPESQGEWHSLEYIAEPEKQATITQAIDTALHTDPVDPITFPPEVRTGNALEKLAMEFLGSHGGDEDASL